MQVTFDSSARQLVVSVAEAISSDAAISVVTPGLRDVETGADVNEPGIIYLPPPEVKSPSATEGGPAENVFFFNDVVKAEGWDLVMNFPAESSGTWKLNGRFSPLGGKIEREVRIPVARLEEGENLIHLEGDWRLVPTLSFQTKIPATTDGRARFKMSVTRPDWSAQVRLVTAGQGSTRVLDEQTVAGVAPQAHELTLGASPWENTSEHGALDLGVGAGDRITVETRGHGSRESLTLK